MRPSQAVAGRLAFFFDFEDLPTAIGAAVGANLMRGDFGFACGAGDEVDAAQSVVGATPIATAFGKLLFGMGSHDS